MTQEFKQSYDEWVKYLEQLGYRKVVTCKECKREETIMCPIKSVWDVMPSGFYCAKGERKTDDD